MRSTENNLLKGYAIQTGSRPISEAELLQASEEVANLIDFFPWRETKLHI